MNQSKSRVMGLDVARALAIAGMIIVNYKLAMGAENAGPGWLRGFTEIFEGRASALFVILAGIGVSLMTAKARSSASSELIRQSRSSLYRRAMFLFAAGILLLLIGWSADILHYYAVFMIVGAALIGVSDKQIAGFIVVIVLTTQIQLLLLDYDQGWSQDFHEYTELWTLPGFFRNLLFNGFHPVFPWLSFFLFGLWLGRKEWFFQQKARHRLLWFAMSGTLFFEMVSWVLTRWTPSVLDQHNTYYHLFTTKPMPPNLLYVLSAASSALAVLVLCMYFTEKFPNAMFVRALISTGQLSLSHYIGHVVIGLVTLELAGVLENGSLVFSSIYALLYYIAAVIFSIFWRERVGRGPVELIMRRLS